ncbi:MAG: c-type cytochrome [Georgfuchsia sp.]
MSDEQKFKLVPLIAGTGIIVAILITLAVVIGRDSKQVDEEEVNMRIQPVAKVELAVANTSSGSRSGEQIVQTACAACHMTGAIGAPKIGDSADWGPRIAVGLDGLLKSAVAGKNAMPPRGGSDATDTELARAIVYMANKSGASFKEPDSP